jgi:hypothetical protein
VSTVQAQEAASIVSLDGATLYVPEVSLTRRVTPVNTLLFVGAFATSSKSEKVQAPLCEFDSENNTVVIKRPEKLLENSKTRVITTRGNADAFLDGISWERRQTTVLAFRKTNRKNFLLPLSCLTEA